MAVHISEPAAPELIGFVHQVLSDLHIPPRLLGYRYLVYILERTAPEPTRLNGLTKDLYVEISKRYRTNWKAVDHDIRTAINACWERGGKEKLCEMARYQLAQRPCVTEFLGIVTIYLFVAIHTPE